MAHVKGPRQEFRVVVSGMEVPPDLQERLNVAIQRATLEVFADLDFGGDRAAVALPLEVKGQTQGIWIAQVARKDAEGLVGGIG
ncbi:MAG TPA: hypothetical protein VH482_04060 [Thermomicrobiales bacterium]